MFGVMVAKYREKPERPAPGACAGGPALPLKVPSWAWAADACLLPAFVRSAPNAACLLSSIYCLSFRNRDES